MVNLLPWRDALRRKRQLQFVMVLAGCALMMFALIIFWCLFLCYKIRTQEFSNDQIQQQLEVLNKKYGLINEGQRDKKELYAKIWEISLLQKRNQQVVLLFDKLTVMLPDKVYIIELNKQGKDLMLIGISKSHNDMAKLVNNINQSQLINKVILQEVISYRKQQNRFILKCFFV